MSSTIERLFAGLTLGSVLVLAGCNKAESPKSPEQAIEKSSNHSIEKTAVAAGVVAFPFDDHPPLALDMIEYMAKSSEDLDYVLGQRKNSDPVATGRLEEAVKDFKHATHYSTHYVENSSFVRRANCIAPMVASPWKDGSSAIACSVRGVVATATDDIVMRDANLFQTQGPKAAGTIQRDFDALNLFRKRAEKIAGVWYKSEPSL